MVKLNGLMGGRLGYDKQFRQRKAVRPSLCWDHKDISLWMKLMSVARPPPPLFPGRVRGVDASGQLTLKLKGVCWQFNEGTCRFGNCCRFKHECSSCGGGHMLSQCFKRGKGRPRDSSGKREDPVKVGSMCPFLNRYPDRAAARLLELGFSEGFRIPCSLQSIPPVARNLRSAFGHPWVVSEKLAKEVALGGMCGPFPSHPRADLVVSP